MKLLRIVCKLRLELFQGEKASAGGEGEDVVNFAASAASAAAACRVRPKL